MEKIKVNEKEFLVVKSLPSTNHPLNDVQPEDVEIDMDMVMEDFNKIQIDNI